MPRRRPGHAFPCGSRIIETTRRMRSGVPRDDPPNLRILILTSFLLNEETLPNSRVRKLQPESYLAICLLSLQVAVNHDIEVCGLNIGNRTTLSSRAGESRIKRAREYNIFLNVFSEFRTSSLFTEFSYLAKGLVQRDRSNHPSTERSCHEQRKFWFSDRPSLIMSAQKAY